MKPYQPDALPLADLDHKRLFALVGDARGELYSAALARMNAVLTGNLVHSLVLLQSLQDYSPLGLRAVTFTFYCHRFPLVVWTFFILISGPKFGEYHITITPQPSKQTHRLTA